MDILTFHEGHDRDYDNVRIYRIPRVPGVSNIRPGLSLKKLICDGVFFCRFLPLILKNNYDVIHAVEESSFMAMVGRLLRRIPYIVDMDSLMSAQIVDRYPWLTHVSPVLRWLESLPIRYAAMVVPMCDTFAQEAQKYIEPDDIVVLRDVSLVSQSDGVSMTVSLRDELSMKGFIVMYIGNLESYQGIDMLVKSFALARLEDDELNLVIIGGREEDIQKYKTLSRDLKIDTSTHFLGPRSVDDIGSYMSQANVLVSPRTQGLNTPMKIYSYLDSGVPVLATDLLTHTQVLNTSIASLVAPEQSAFAEGILHLKRNPESGARLADNAKKYVAREHSLAKFTQTVDLIYERMQQKIDGLHR